MGKKVVPKLRQEVKVKVDIVTSDDIKIYFTGKFQDFTARYIINPSITSVLHNEPMGYPVFICWYWYKMWEREQNWQTTK